MKVLKMFAITFFVSVLAASMALTPSVSGRQGAPEAPAVFDDLTNGFTDQAQFNLDKAAFEQREEKADGLGPVYNAQSGAECHQNRLTGGTSQIMELRAGHSAPDGTFAPAAGGSLIQSRAINTALQERVPGGPRIAFKNNAGHLGVVAFDLDALPVGNQPRLGSFPSFSPDGQRIAFKD